MARDTEEAGVTRSEANAIADEAFEELGIGATDGARVDLDAAGGDEGIADTTGDLLEQVAGEGEGEEEGAGSEGGDGAEGAEGDDGDALDDMLVEDDEEPKPGEPLRNEDGTFKKADTPAPKAGEPKAGTAAAAATPAAGTEPAKSAAATERAWKPLGVTFEKAVVAIPEAQFADVGEHFEVRIPKASMPAFMGRLSKGIAGEKMWRQLQQGLKDVEAEKDAPALKSDAQIEAEVMLEAIKPHIAGMFDETEMKLLEAQVKLAQRENKDGHATKRQEWVDDRRRKDAEANAPAEEQEHQLRGMTQQMFNTIRSTPELAGMSEAEIRGAYADLLPIRRSILWKEGDGWYMNTELLLKTLTKHKGTATAASTTATPDTGTTAAATASTGKPGTTRADHHNAGVDSAGKPATSSLSARRGTPTPRRGAPPANASTRDRPRAKDPAMAAEDTFRAKSRKFMASPTLDFDDDDED